MIAPKQAMSSVEVRLTPHHGQRSMVNVRVMPIVVERVDGVGHGER